MPDYPPSVLQDLNVWRRGAAAIGDALAAGEAADWPAARAAYDAVLGRLSECPDGVAYAAADMGGVSALVAVPASVRRGRRLLYLHGGGYCSGSAEAYRGLAGQLARRLDARVYVPDYRLAPQHPHPAQILDAMAAYCWLLTQGDGPIVLAGDSAGGAMVVTLMRRVRDAGLAPPAAGVAISPWANLAHDGASMRDPARHDPLVEVGYLDDLAAAFAPSVPRDHPDISPVHADLDGLPPVLILAGEREVMLSDAVRLAGRLAESRVRVSLEAWPGMFHVWPVFAGRLREADEALDRAAAFLDAACTAPRAGNTR